MIAEVYPIMRMPRHVRVFDYAIPEELHHLKRGDVVVIPFRNTSIFGVIARVKDVADHGFRLKSITRYDSRVVFSDTELKLFENIAIELAQSVPSILNSCLPEFPKRVSTKTPSVPPNEPLTISPSELDGLQLLAQQLTERSRAFVYTSDIRRMACVIAGFVRLKPDQKCIVLCPTILDAQRLYAHLPIETRFLLTGEENTGTQFSVWNAFRKTDACVMVGTKNCLFAVDTKTTTIFVARSSHENHGHHEQNPRFDARTLSHLIAEHHHTNLFFLDVMPRIEDTVIFSKTNILGSSPNLAPQIIDMEHQSRASAIGHWISHETYQTTQSHLERGERVLVVLNKKYHARRLACLSCGSDVVCETCGNGMILDDLFMRCVRCKSSIPIIRSCPKCHEITLKESGFGNQKIDALLRKEFPNTTTCLIDKEHPHMNAIAPLVIATSYYLEQMANAFKPDQFALVVVLDADAPLFRPTYRASEAALYECEGWRALAFANRAQFFVQTRSVPFFTEYFQNPTTSLAIEREARQSYIQPPFCEISTLHFDEKEPRKADIFQNQLVQQIRGVSSMARIKKTKSQNQNEYLLEIRYPQEDRSKLLTLFRSFPDRVIIDTQANTG
jgi:primosomal protein N'